MQHPLHIIYSGRLLLLTVMLYAFAPLAAGCGAAGFTFCAMGSQNAASTDTCCPDNASAPASLQMVQIADLSGTSASCHKEASEKSSSTCTSCPCITDQLASATLPAAIVQQAHNDSKLMQLAALTLSALLKPASEQSVSESVSKFALHQYSNIRANAAPLRIQHCSYLI